MADLVHRDTWPLWVVFLVGFAFRLHGFNEYWLNPDEGIYYSMVTWESWDQFYEEFSANAHPPLFYVLLRLIGGISLEFGALRSIALVFGCACAPAVYLLAKECAGRGKVATWTGLLAGLGVAVSHTAVEMSQIIRPYTMQFACSALGVWLLLRFAQRGGRRCLPAYAACMILAVLTHYGAILLLAGLAIPVVAMQLAGQLKPQRFRAIVIWNVPIVLAVLAIYFLHIRPNLEGSELAQRAYESWLEPMMIDSPGEAWQNFLAVLSHFGKEFEGPLSLVLVAGIAGAFWRKRIFIAVFPIGTLAIAIAASVADKYPFGYSRHSLYTVIALAPVLGFAFAEALRTWRTAIPALAAATALVFLRADLSEALGRMEGYRRFENTLTSEDYAAMRGMLDHAANTRGVVLLSTQSYCMLMPEFAKERQDSTLAPDESMRRFRWRNADVIVSKAWSFSMKPEHLGNPIHVYDFTAHVDRVHPDLRVGSSRRVTLISGGWSEVWETIQEFRESGGPQARLVSRGQAVPGLLVIDLDIAGYRHFIRATHRVR